MKHKEQRVLVLFDVQNLYYSAKQLYHAKVDFSNILAKAISSRKLIRAIAYVIKTDIKEEVNFHDALNKIGIEVKAKDLQIFLGGAKKGDWDIGIAMDAVRLNSKVDVVVLVSGDGDFKDLLQYLQSHGCRAEVIAFGRTASKHIKDIADDFIDLEKDPQRYLINYRRPAFNPQKKGGSNIQSQPLQHNDTNNQHQNTNNSNNYNNNTHNIHSASLHQEPAISNSPASTKQSILPMLGPTASALPAMKPIKEKEAEQKQIIAQEKKEERKEEKLFERKQEEKKAEERREEIKEEKLFEKKQEEKKAVFQKKDGFIKKITSKLKKK